MRFSYTESIFEEGEYCEVCGSVVNLLTFEEMITVCGVCKVSGKFEDYLVVEFEKALALSPDFERTSNGGFRRK
jgi:hypothetical protein